MPASREVAPRVPEEISLDTARGTVAGLHWPADGSPPAMDPNAGAPRVLAIHGWLDNAASFVPIAPHLEGLDLVAIDLPGHGHSHHRPAGANYYFTEYLFDLDAVLDALAWPECHLVGHSLGGAIASTYAAAAPERVLSLTALDGFGPVSAPPTGATDRLRRSLASIRNPRSQRKVYDSLDRMVAARLANSKDLDADAARLICERASRPVDGGCEWRFDPALYWNSPVLMTEEQVLDCLAAITAPVLTLTALPLAPWVTGDQVRRRTEAAPHGVHESVAGNHHFHMDQAAVTGARVAAFIHQQAARNTDRNEKAT